MKILIAVCSCERDRQFHKQARETWLKDCSVDYVFVLGGQQPNLQPDELFVDAPDDYWGLKDKVKKLIKYSLQKEYDYLFKCDIDTYCHVPRLLRSGFENHEWSGFGQPYGGSGYWLSRKAMQALSDYGEDIDNKREGEDWWVERNLTRLGFKPYLDKRYHSLTNDGPAPNNDIITSHWYSEHGVRERIVHADERLASIPKYHQAAQEIKE